jgi:hypothetical protein
MVGYFNIKLGGAWDIDSGIYPLPCHGHFRVGPLMVYPDVVGVLIAACGNSENRSEDKFYMLCGKCNFFVILFLFLPLWGACANLNMPFATTYRFGITLLHF